MGLKTGKLGDKVQLARKEGILIDYETGFEVVNAEEKKLGNPVGQRTQLAIQSGGLLVISSKSSKSSKKGKDDGDGSDLPLDLPGREAFLEADLTFEQLKKMTEEETALVKGIGPAKMKELIQYSAKK